VAAQTEIQRPPLRRSASGAKIRFCVIVVLKALWFRFDRQQIGSGRGPSKELWISTRASSDYGGATA
jgi:hypothetical protein